ncbi:MAG: type II toxin-antitoxin system VapC family toxin [Candidatus Margulisbacteria bacterium]|jgi:PIN domain nuclease of toxin-antitoxin system|nr:type II toxin-antitoxin system VapC family toxin [Candidatus Margulisiibacteriota bacterium]
MNYLVDTHILIWAFSARKKISPTVLNILSNENNLVYYSPVSLWEIAIKYGVKKLTLAGYTPEEFFAELETRSYICLPLNNLDLITNYQLPMRHRDPFDRLLIWTALQNNLTFLTVDRTAARYVKDGLKCVW